jgi:hypothetical protein
MNIKDFCGSQELNLIVKKRPIQRNSSFKKSKNEEGESLSSSSINHQHPLVLNSKSVTNFISNSNKNYIESSASMHSFADTKLENLNQKHTPSPNTFFLTAENSCANSTSSSSMSSSQDQMTMMTMMMSGGCGNESANKLINTFSHSSIIANNQPAAQENYYSSSLISDYRLTLTDLLELNLIDVTNGLIINPVNGMRLSVADAIRIDLLNSDVKEIANTFLKSNCSNGSRSSTCLKLTVKEAIQLSVLNANKNEIYLSKSSNQTLKLNLYDAKKRNLILKPLTLSEAFIRNLIQPNGFVRNPINNKYYTFEHLITNDLKLMCCCPRTKKHQDQDDYDEGCMVEEEEEFPMHVFDFDTKHIIDPNDPDKRLLSLSEAIEIGLILPHTFELSLSSRLGLCTNTQTKIGAQKLNLYDAFFNTKHLNLSLLLYKPEIENVFVKLMCSSDLTQSTKVGILLSKREKIGLIEAINLNVIDLNTCTYSTLLYSNDENLRFSLSEAIYKYRLVDVELLDLLNTPIGLKRNKCEITVLDSLRDSSLILEKYLYKNPFSNDYMQLDSHTCKAMLSEDVVKKIKRLITRINVKSYIISLNHNGQKNSSSGSTTNLSRTNSTQLINVKNPTVVYNKIHQKQQRAVLSSVSFC